MCSRREENWPKIEDVGLFRASRCFKVKGRLREYSLRSFLERIHSRSFVNGQINKRKGTTRPFLSIFITLATTIDLVGKE